MSAQIVFPKTDPEIQDCFPVLSVLRPHLRAELFVAQVRRQQQHGYQLVAQMAQTRIVSAAGFRITEFLAWGKVLYVDDLITQPENRGHGYAGQLMNWLIDHAKASGCQALHLDTGYVRHDAHRLYLNKGLRLNAHHMSITF